MLKNESVLFVADYLNNAIRRIDLLNDSYVSTPFPNIMTPTGMVVDGGEIYMYVASADCVIYKLPLYFEFPLVVSNSQIISGSASARPSEFLVSLINIYLTFV